MPGLTEHALIQKYFRPLATRPEALGLLDDAAVLSPKSGYDMVLSVDTIVEGVHFPFGEDPALIAARALRVNISDMIAKGADPEGYLLSVALPQDTPETWFAAFSEALRADQNRYDLALLGGDSVRFQARSENPSSSQKNAMIITASILGVVPSGAAVLRSNAQVGDALLVTGSIGDAALGLRCVLEGPFAGLSPAQNAELEASYRTPSPPFGISAALRQHAHAAMDVSDGLIGDLDKLCNASGVSAVVEAAAVPLSAAARQAVTADPGLLEVCLTGGDDYQVLAAMPQSVCPDFVAACNHCGVAASRIGRIVEVDSPVLVLGADGQPIPIGRRAYSHGAM